jgi:hypothetical protein
MIIVYRAMMMFAASEAAPEVEFEGSRNYATYLNMLEADQLPPFEVAGPLA